MKFTSPIPIPISLLFFGGTLVNAVTRFVTVDGAGSQLTFIPDSITAAVGDTIQFISEEEVRSL